MLERFEEFLVAFDVLATIGFHAGVDRAFRSFVCERLCQLRKRWILDEFHCKGRRQRNAMMGELDFKASLRLKAVEVESDCLLFVVPEFPLSVSSSPYF